MERRTGQRRSSRTQGETGPAQLSWAHVGSLLLFATTLFLAFLGACLLLAQDVSARGIPLLMPTPVAPTPAPTHVPGVDDPHVHYDANTSSCAACHCMHTSGGPVLRTAWPEEDVCLVCHGNLGPATDIASALSYANTATAFLKHPVGASQGLHDLNESSGADFAGARRHVECEDCHDPHEATRGPAAAPLLQREMNQVSGVDPNWTGPGAPEPGLYSWLPQAEREYQVCFKCHSSFTALPTYVPDGWDGVGYVADGLSKLTSSVPGQAPDSRDMAQEFNPYNASYHPVVAPGENQSIPAGSFVTGWSQDSMVYCTDCHSNAGGPDAGPHGSPRLHLLDGGRDYTTVMTGTRPADQELELCFKCHEAATYLDETNAYANLTNFRKSAGNRNLHGTHMTRSGSRAATCYSCHDTHGSEQVHLLNFQIVPGVLAVNTGDSQSAWRPNGSQRECALTCHGRSHSGASYRYP